MKIKLLLFFTVLVSVCYSQQKINWETLRDVKFSEKYNEEINAYTQVPAFGNKVKALSGKEVEIAGYMIPLDIPGGIYVLSANPFAACFFCGGSGPETVMDLKFTKKPRRYKTDEKITFKGVLRLNTTDIYQLNYILDNAKPAN